MSLLEAKRVSTDHDQVQVDTRDFGPDGRPYGYYRSYVRIASYILQ